MDTRRVLYFLNMLSGSTSGHRDELASLYTQALNENDDVRQLRYLYEQCNYFGELGRMASQSAKRKLEQVYADPANAIEHISGIRIENESILKEIAVCDELMHSPYPIVDNISILRKKNVPAYREVLRRIAGACIYMLLIYNGPDAIRDLKWSDESDFKDKLYAVNNKLLPEILKLRRPGHYWVIRRKSLGGKALFGGDGFYLTYESVRDIDRMAMGFKVEPVGTHAFLNAAAFDLEEKDVPLCWGTGNLTSLTPANAIEALGKVLVTELKSPSGAELAGKMPAPTVLMTILADERHYCITPDVLVRAMNQWVTGHEIRARKETGRCLFCGRPLEGRRRPLVCPSHFNI